MVTVLALGSNELDAERIFNEVIPLLAAQGFSNSRLSSLFRTKPVDCPPGTPDFFNAVLAGDWAKSPLELLQITQEIEVRFGRPRNHARNVARPLDIDLILMGSCVLNQPELIVPHPRALEREFVMAPLRALHPELVCQLEHAVSLWRQRFGNGHPQE